MRIQHNIPAMNAYRNFRNNSSALNRNLEKLSSGYRINRAGDDAAGLAISEKMRAQISGLTTAQSNAKDGISLVQTAEGALTEVHDMLNRMVTLAEQSANGTYGDDLDRVQLQKEVDQLRTEINRISDSANFNGIKLLDGSMDASNAKAASTVTTYNSSFNWTVKGIGTKAVADVGTDIASDLGIKTITHKDAGEAAHAGFSINLGDYTVTDAGTLSITVGSGTATTTLSVEITADMVASGDKLNASDLAKMFADKYATATGTKALTFGSASTAFTVSNDGKYLRFESTKNTPVTIAEPVTVSMKSAEGDSTAGIKYDPKNGVGSKTNAGISFSFASGVGAADQNTYIAAAGTNGAATVGITVSIAQKLNAAAFNGSVAKTPSSAVAASDLGSASNVASMSSTLKSVTLVENADANSVSLSLGSTANSIKITNANTYGGVPATDVNKVVMGISFDITNGANSGVVTFNVKATDVSTTTIEALGTAAATRSKTITLKDTLTYGTGGGSLLDKSKTLADAATAEVKGSTVKLTSSETSNGGAVVYSSVAGLTAEGITADDTVSLRFTFGTTTSKVDVTLEMKLSDIGTVNGSNVSFSASTVNDALAKRFKDLFGKSSPSLEGKVASNGNITFTAGHDIASIGSMEVGLTSNVSNLVANGSKSVSDTVTFIFKLNTLNSEISTSATLANGESKTVTATSAKLNILSAQSLLVNTVNDSTWNTTNVTTVNGLVGSYSKGSWDSLNVKLALASGAKTTDTVTLSVTVGGQKVGLNFTLKDLGVDSDVGASGGEVSADTIKTKAKEKLEKLFGKTTTVTDDAVDIASDTVKLSLGSAASGYSYKAVLGTATTVSTLGTSVTLSAVASSGKLQVGSDGMVEIEIWGSGASGSKIGSFKVNVSDLKASTTTKAYAADATTATALTEALKVKLTKAAENAAGGGTYNTDTEKIEAGASEKGTRLASTKILVDTAATSASATTGGKISNIFFGKIKDGAAMKIGDETYIFAVGSKSKINADENGSKLVDLKDLDSSTNGFTSASAGLASDALKIALKRLTVAAKDNAMFGVGYDETSGDFTLVEHEDYYTGSNVLLNTAKKIADQVQFGTVRQKSTTEDVEEFKAKDLTLQIGDTSDEFNQLRVSIKDMHTDAIGIGSIDISTQAGAQAAVDKIKNAINYVSDVRGGLGATQNRLEHTINNLSVMVENITDAESTIRDTDIAAEMMTYTKNSILNQAAQAMLAQANQLPQGVLQLLG